MKKKGCMPGTTRKRKTTTEKRHTSGFFFLFNSCYIFDIKINKKKKKGQINP